jgi:hypothetical protein
MNFKITLHSGARAPEDALEALWGRLGARRQEVSFSRVGREIRARTSEDAPVSMTRDERTEVGRRLVIEIVQEVCEQSPELRWSWFAVGSGE